MEENKNTVQPAKLTKNDVLDKLNNKDFGIYFFTLDTKGNPSAGIANIYESVKILTELGYKAYIMHEKNDYTSVESWLGEEYAKLPHISIEAQKLNVGPADFIVIPEVFSTVMDQTKAFPSKRIAMCQSYDYIFEMLNFGVSWGQYGIYDVITTSQKQADYIKTIFPSAKTYVVPVSIPDYFKASAKPKKPIIAISARDQKDTLKLIKSFYVQFPTYKWVTFKELRGLPRKDFAELLGECCCSVFIDRIAGFGTFPIESMECDVPVIGLIPRMIPEWMEGAKTDDGLINLKNNGVWTNSELELPGLIAQFLKVFLEDAIPQNILDTMKESKGQYTYDKQKTAMDVLFTSLVETRKSEIAAL